MCVFTIYLFLNTLLHFFGDIYTNMAFPLGYYIYPTALHTCLLDGECLSP
uniref:Uncharacterized protein n=1 Tax=Arundo donax TaxID=35708 RepID=A0A0A9ENX0_ARUDO